MVPSPYTEDRRGTTLKVTHLEHAESMFS
jgi:hypothetical protein